MCSVIAHGRRMPRQKNGQGLQQVHSSLVAWSLFGVEHFFLSPKDRQRAQKCSTFLTFRCDGVIA